MCVKQKCNFNVQKYDIIVISVDSNAGFHNFGCFFATLIRIREAKMMRIHITDCMYDTRKADNFEKESLVYADNVYMGRKHIRGDIKRTCVSPLAPPPPPSSKKILLARISAKFYVLKC